MTLLDLCDPLFQYVCRFNRSARKGAHHDLEQVRADVQAILKDMKTTANKTPGLLAQFERVELPLIFFVDFTVKSSGIPNAHEWAELAFERKELAGDEKFFDLLDETLADRSESASERIGVFYTCMGLGFTGWYTGQPEYLRKKMMECAGRLRGVIDTDQTAKICPEAYDHVDTSDLIEPPSASLVGIGIILVGLAAVLFLANIYLYHASSNELTKALDHIVSTGNPTASK
jgi:type IV/VI secretion system ImpK/VasF family protein